MFRVARESEPTVALQMHMHRSFHLTESADIARDAHWAVDLTQLAQCADTVRAPELIGIARAFEQSLAQIHCLHMMPWHIAAEGARLFYWTLKYIQSMDESVLDTIQNKESLSDVIGNPRKDIHAERANAKFQAFISDNDGLDEFTERIREIMRTVGDRDSIQSALSTIAVVTIPLTWSAIECLCRDLWVVLLNSGDRSLAQRAFSAVESQGFADGISTKHVAVSTLARYSFDIRGHVGTILEGKFKFSDIEGIRGAFTALFGEPSMPVSALTDARLRALEKSRHLILHKSGIIDAKYKRESGSTQEIGERVNVLMSTLVDWGQATIDSGISLIQFADGWLLDQQKHRDATESSEEVRPPTENS